MGEIMTFGNLLANPTTIKILLVLLDTGQAYQFELVTKTGAHPSTIKVALKVLIDLKLVKIEVAERHVKNVGKFYGLTQHGKEVAEQLQTVATLLERHR